MGVGTAPGPARVAGESLAQELLALLAPEEEESAGGGAQWRRNEPAQ